MIKKYRNYLLGIIGILLTISIFLGIKYLMQPKNKEIPEVKLREIKNSKAFAIMIQNGDNYQEYTEDTWPGADYIYKEAKCVDNKGAIVDNVVTFEDDEVTLTTDKTVSCTLYFIKIPEIVKQLRVKDKELSGGIEHLSLDLQGEMFRYQGTDDVPNWICFGTTDKNQCINEADSDGNSIPDGIDKYMYRIIGITEEGQMYLLKETFIKEGNVIGFVWNSKYDISNCLGDKCEWPNVDLYKRLNGSSNGEIQGSGNNDGANTNIFVDSSEYEYMAKDDDWYNLIADHNWLYGDTHELSKIYKGNEMYGIETGKVTTKRFWPDENIQTTCSSESPCTEKEYTWSNDIPAKIGLMYMHDIDYAYLGENSENITNFKDSWIFFQKDGYNIIPTYEYLTYEWLITRYGVFDTSVPHVSALFVISDGTFGYNNLANTLGVRPTFYLSSQAKIKDGDGTKANPYILDVQEELET